MTRTYETIKTHKATLLREDEYVLDYNDKRVKAKFVVELHENHEQTRVTITGLPQGNHHAYLQILGPDMRRVTEDITWTGPDSTPFDLDFIPDSIIATLDSSDEIRFTIQPIDN